MNPADCRARPGWECECCSCTADKERDTDPAPAPALHGIAVTPELVRAATMIMDAWEASDANEMYDLVDDLTRLGKP